MKNLLFECEHIQRFVHLKLPWKTLYMNKWKGKEILLYHWEEWDESIQWRKVQNGGAWGNVISRNCNQTCCTKMGSIFIATMMSFVHGKRKTIKYGCLKWFKLSHQKSHNHINGSTNTFSFIMCSLDKSFLAMQQHKWLESLLRHKISSTKSLFYLNRKSNRCEYTHGH